MDPYGITSFCEDIRYEASTQITLVGVFTGDVTLPQAPMIIPKLGVVSKLNLPWNFDAETAVWKIYFPGDPLDAPGFQAELSVRESLEENRKRAPTLNVDDDVVLSHNLQYQVVLSPVQIKHAGLIKVRIVVGDQLVKAGTLRVLIVAPNELP